MLRNNLHANNAELCAHAHNNIGVVDGLSLGIVSVKGNELFEVFALLTENLQHFEVGSFSKMRVGDSIVSIQNQAASAFQEHRLLVRTLWILVVLQLYQFSWDSIVLAQEVVDYVLSSFLSSI